MKSTRLIIIDNSPSMHENIPLVRESLLGFIRESKSLEKKGIEVRTIIYSFSDVGEILFNSVNNSIIPNDFEESYNANGNGTALYRSVIDAFRFIPTAETGDGQDSIEIIIVTDGQDNMSTNQDLRVAKEEIAKWRDRNAAIIFVGVGEEELGQQAIDMGISKGNVMSVNSNRGGYERFENRRRKMSDTYQTAMMDFMADNSQTRSLSVNLDSLISEDESSE